MGSDCFAMIFKLCHLISKILQQSKPLAPALCRLYLAQFIENKFL
jgi:hypothetical protein